MKVLKVGIASYEDMKARTMAIARGALKPKPGEPKVWFPSAESLVRVLSDRNRALLATTSGAFASVGGIKADVDVQAIGSLKNKDDIVKALAATFAFAHKAVANVTAANAFQSIRGTQTPVTAFAGAIGHAEDEYGQAVEYLRMNAIVPPASEGRPRM